MIITAVIFLVIALVAIGWRRQPHRGRATAGRMNAGREVLSDDEYRQMLAEDAQSYRCPHPAYTGDAAKTCRRAPGRPCVSGCNGRKKRYLDTRWHG